MIVVANSSVLIALSRIGMLDFLHHKFPEGLVIPEAVWGEVVEGGKAQPGAKEVSLAEIRNKGWEALVKELRYSGATKFILLYEPGKGDYVKERRELFKGTTLEDVAREMKRGKRERGT